jgi:hypothetical protein
MAFPHDTNRVLLLFMSSCTVHGMLGWSHNICGANNAISIGAKQLTRLRAFYSDTEVFIIDEVNTLSAEGLARLNDTMVAIFAPTEKTPEGDSVPFGGKKMIFLGDPAQLRPVGGEAIYDEGSGSTANYNRAERARGSFGMRQRRLHLSQRGKELYRKYIEPNVMWMKRSQRNSGLLLEICDHIRDGTQTPEDLVKLGYQRRRFPDTEVDWGIRFTNEACSLANWEQVNIDNICFESYSDSRIRTKLVLS